MDSGSVSYLDLNALRQQRYDAAASTGAAQIDEAAGQFEGLFTQIVMRSMRDASFSEDLFSSDQTQFFEDMLDSQLTTMAGQEGSMGLAKQISERMAQYLPQSSTDLAGTRNNDSGGSADALLVSGEFMPIPLERTASALRNNSAIAAYQQTAPIALERSNSEASVAAAAPVVAQAKYSTNNQYFTLRMPVHVDFGAARSAASVSPVNQAARVTSDTSGNPASEFAQAVLPYAKQAASRIGVDPRVLVAQAALETGWGKHMPRDAQGQSSYNLFGIKAGSSWRGATVTAGTQEFTQSRFVDTSAQFRAYDNFGASFDDYASLISGSRRYAGAVAVAADPQAYAKALQEAGYATDPRYAEKILNLYENPVIQGISGV